MNHIWQEGDQFRNEFLEYIQALWWYGEQKSFELKSFFY